MQQRACRPASFLSPICVPACVCVWCGQTACRVSMYYMLLPRHARVSVCCGSCSTVLCDLCRVCVSSIWICDAHLSVCVSGFSFQYPCIDVPVCLPYAHAVTPCPVTFTQTSENWGRSTPGVLRYTLHTLLCDSRFLSYTPRSLMQLLFRTSSLARLLFAVSFNRSIRGVNENGAKC